MNRIQRAATAAIAFTITLAGSVSVIAPLALGNVQYAHTAGGARTLGCKLQASQAIG